MEQPESGTKRALTLSSVQVPHLHIKIFLCLILILSLTIVGIAQLCCDNWTISMPQK